MILEAFAKYLQEADPEVPASFILARWLWERLSFPPETNVDKVIHCELTLATRKTQTAGSLRLEADHGGTAYVFNALSDSGRKLLQSLHQYSLSYEQQKWARWVHFVKASDFNERHRRG